METAHIIHAFLGFTSTRLGFEVSCPRTLPQRNPEDPVRLEPRIPGLRVKHFTTEPHGTLVCPLGKRETVLDNKILDFDIESICRSNLYQRTKSYVGPNSKHFQTTKYSFNANEKLKFGLGRVGDISGTQVNSANDNIFLQCNQKRCV